MFRSKKQQQEYVVIGLGRFGASLASALAQNGYTVLGVDRDPKLVQSLANDQYTTMALDTTHEAALVEAGIHHFDTVIVAIGTDFESNILTTSALKSLGVRNVICKALTDRQKAILMRLGADRVILPEIEAGQRLAQELVAPSVFSRLYVDEHHGLLERSLPPGLVGKTLREIDLRNRLGITILVVYRNGDLIASPHADFRLEEGDTLLLIGAYSDLKKLDDFR